MKLRKFIATTLPDYLNEQLNQDDDDEYYDDVYDISIPKTKLNGEFYHGSIILDDEDLFSEFGLGYSDWDAIWLADDETVADEFSGWHGDERDNEIKVVFRIKIDINLIADISYELSETINEIWELSDFREAIPLLEQRGFNGWVTVGSYDKIRYNDIAIFDPDQIEIQDVKLFINGDWTDFISVNDAQELIKKTRQEKQNK